MVKIYVSKMILSILNDITKKYKQEAQYPCDLRGDGFSSAITK